MRLLTMYSDIYRIAISLGFALGFPIVVFASGRIWFRIVGGSTSRINKAWATACLLLTIASLGMMIKVGFEIIRAVWLIHPVAASFVYFIFWVLVPVILIYMIVRLWRPRTNEP